MTDEALEQFYAERRAAAAAPEMTLVVDDKTFMSNVRDALGNGYDRVCAQCGVGVYDDGDIHERACPEFREEMLR